MASLIVHFGLACGNYEFDEKQCRALWVSSKQCPPHASQSFVSHHQQVILRVQSVSILVFLASAQRQLTEQNILYFHGLP